MFHKLAFASLILAVAFAEDALMTCPTEALVEPYPDCAQDLVCDWALDIQDGTGTQTCSCTSGKAFECVFTALLDPVSVTIVTSCPELPPIDSFSGDTIPICDRDLNCSWPFDVDGMIETETCFCAPDTGLVCQRGTNSIPVPYGETNDIISCPAEPFSFTEPFENYTCINDFNCTWVLDIPDGAGGMDCVCVAGNIMLCSAWAVLSESVDPSTLPAGHVAGGMRGSKEAKTKKNKGLTGMSMAKRKDVKKAKGEKVSEKEIDKGLRGRVR